jgi:hypothetical protein
LEARAIRQRSRKFRAVGTVAAFDLDEFGDRFGTEAGEVGCHRNPLTSMPSPVQPCLSVETRGYEAKLSPMILRSSFNTNGPTTA